MPYYPFDPSDPQASSQSISELFRAAAAEAVKHRQRARHLCAAVGAELQRLEQNQARAAVGLSTRNVHRGTTE